MKKLFSPFVIGLLYLALLTPNPAASDDASIAAPPELPASGEHNVVKNSSFEVGTEGYGIIRAEYLKTGQQEIPYYEPVLDAKEKFHGLNSLRIDNPNGGSVRFFSQPFEVDPSQQYMLSFAARAGIAGQDVAVNLETAEGRYGETGHIFSVTDKWQRYSFGPVTIPDGRHFCKIQLMWGIYSRLKTGTSLWLDAFQVQAAPAAGYAPRPLEIGIVNGLPRHYTQTRTQHYPVRFKIRNNSAAPASSRIRYRVIDEYFHKVVAQGEVKAFSVPGNTTIEKTLANVSPGKRGKFTLMADLVGPDAAVLDHSELGFAVIDSVKKGPGQFTDAFSISDIVTQQGGRPMGPLGEATDLWAFYGGSADELFDFRAQAGDRWIRSWDFNWSNIEPQSGQYNWTLTDIFVRKARERGIRVMPTLGDEFILDNNRDLPQWLRDDPQSAVVPRTIDPRHQVLLPPLDKWVRYVRACVQRYKGTINTWEILNEPNLYITSDNYLLYLKSAYETIKQVDPQARVVAFSSSQDYGGAAVQYLEASFKQGALNYCDVVGFHPYGARLDWSTPLSAEGMNTQIRELRNRYGGAGKELWSTELYHVGKPGGPGEDDNYLGRSVQGHEHARRYLIDLATGLGRSFTIPEFNCFSLFAPKSWAVNNHLSVGMVPSNTFVIYNTITLLFEGAKPQGQIALSGKNKLYLYAKANATIAAAWSFDWDNKPSQLSIPNAAGKLQVLDIMGNPSDQAQQHGRDLVLTLTNSPLYILTTERATSHIRLLLQGAKVTALELPLKAQGLDRP